jgi:hypothetical protein
LLLKEQEEPSKALVGQGEILMSESDTDLVQKQLSELAQQIVHVIKACNEEKDILKEDFDSVRNGILIMESRLQTEKTRIDTEVQGVGSMVQCQKAVLDELRSGIHILHEQDNQIAGEATDLFAGIRAELEAQSKKRRDYGLQIFAQKCSIQALQKPTGTLSKWIDNINTAVTAITQSLKTIPTKQELRQHKIVMEESLNTMAEVNTGLTTARDQDMFSESTPLGVHRTRNQTVAGPSSKRPYVHSERLTTFLSPSVSSLRDTGSEYSQDLGLRGGAESNAGGADDGAAGAAAGGAPGGAAGEAAGGGDGGPAGEAAAAGGADGGGGPPPPPNPPPSNNGGRRMSRRRRRTKQLEFAKQMKIKEPKKFYGKAGEDFDTWWVLVQVYIKDQPERLLEDERTINWIVSLMESYAASCHIHWLKAKLAGTYPNSMTGYIKALSLRFEDKDVRDEAYTELEKVRYEGCIRDMFTQIQTHNDKALVTAAALKKLILERLPQKILDQIHIVDLTGKTDQEMISMITNAGRTVEKWDAARKNLGFQAQFRIKEQGHQSFRKKEKEESSKNAKWRGKKRNDHSERMKFKKDRLERKPR